MYLVVSLNNILMRQETMHFSPTSIKGLHMDIAQAGYTEWVQTRGELIIWGSTKYEK